MARRRRAAGAVVAAAALALSMSACGTTQRAGADGAVSVVAVTDVYSDIAHQIAGRLAGDRVAITSVISDPSVDPHSYEANTRAELALARADVIIENGGGYDDFMDTMRHAAGTDATLINVVKLAGPRARVDGVLNEHVWYDLPTVGRLVDRIATVLADRDPTDAPTYRANAATFTKKLAALEHDEATIRATHAGAGLAITEPVPLHLTQACGLVNRTPGEFSRAIENGTDVSPRVLRETLALFRAHQVKLLAYNEQTSDAVTGKVLASARAAHVPVVPVTETLPAKSSYLAWMGRIIAAVRTALGPTAP